MCITRRVAVLQTKEDKCFRVSINHIPHSYNVNELQGLEINCFTGSPSFSTVPK